MFFLRNSAQLFSARAGYGVGGLRHDHRGLLHRQPRRLPRPRQAPDLAHRHQRSEGELVHFISFIAHFDMAKNQNELDFFCNIENVGEW